MASKQLFLANSQKISQNFEKTIIILLRKSMEMNIFADVLEVRTILEERGSGFRSKSSYGLREHLLYVNWSQNYLK